MYTDADLTAAVQAGAISAEAADALRHYTAQQRQSPAVDEENFRLLNSFNDVFVVIASVLLLVAVGVLGGSMLGPIGAGFAIAAAAWGLAEFFTRQRRMALPSIVLLLAYVGGVAFSLITLTQVDQGLKDAAGGGLVLAITAMIAAATWLHWRRFHVPITVAAGAGVVVLALSACVTELILPEQEGGWLACLFVAGLAVFTLAMRWDMSDPSRQTQRADVAFWLHLLAAPLLVHPIFSTLGSGAHLSVAAGLAIVGLYVLLAAVSLLIDRRALMVSALVYVVYALNMLLKQFGEMGINFALTALLISSLLLTLSAFWHPCRMRLLAYVPQGWLRYLPSLA